MSDLPLTVAYHWDSPEGREMAQEYARLERCKLAHPALSDFALANAVFLVGRDDLRLIGFQTAAKERIRWLSVQLAIAKAENEKLKIACEGINPEAVPDMLAALKLVVPTGICLTNKNVPDSTIIPLDVPLGDLRKIAAAIAKAEAQS